MSRSYAKRVWHANWTRPCAVGKTGPVNADEAREALAAAVHERDAAKASWDMAREHLYDVIRAAVGPLTQAEVCRITGYTRERVRLVTPRPPRPNPDPRP